MAEPMRCARCAAVVPWFSLWGNLGLAVYKLIVGLLGGSAALVADAVHSFADVIGSTGIVVATRVSNRHPDAGYQYGRGKAEFIGAVFVYTILVFFALGIVAGSIRSMLQTDLTPPHFVTVLGAVVSVFYNYLMYRFATCAGKRNNSPAILADAFENRADAISSVACIVGIVAAMTIHPVCDPIAALLVGVIIFHNCVQQLREAVQGLMDRGLPEEQVDAIRRTVLEQEGVLAVGYVRTRQTGVRFWVDIGIEVSPALAVTEADAITTAVREQVVRNTPQCHYVEVYVIPALETNDIIAGEPARS